jgi:hypothetical protein
VRLRPGVRSLITTPTSATCCTPSELLHAYGHRMGFLTKLDFDNLLLDELPVNQLAADWGP